MATVAMETKKRGGVVQNFLFYDINSFKVCIIRLYLYIKGFWSHCVTKWPPLPWKQKRGVFLKKKFYVINSFKVYIIRLYLYLKDFRSHCYKMAAIAMETEPKKGGELDFDLKWLEKFFR